MFNALRHYSSVFSCLINFFGIGQFRNIDFTGTGDHSFNALRHFFFFFFCLISLFRTERIRILVLQVQVIIRSMHFAISFPFSFVSSIFQVLDNLRTLITGDHFFNALRHLFSLFFCFIKLFMLGSWILILGVQVITCSSDSSIFLCWAVLEYWVDEYMWSFV